MSETKNHHLESDPQAHQWEELYTGFELSESGRQDIQSHIAAGMQTVAEQSLDTTVTDIAQVGARYYDWLLTGERGDELPEGLALSEYRFASKNVATATRYEVTVDPNHPAGVAGPVGAIRLFEAMAPQAIENAVFSYYEQVTAHDRRDENREHIEAMVTATPMYRYLELFDSRLSTTEQTPLSSQEQWLRSNQIEQDVRQRYGIDEKASLQAGTPAWREYHRQTYRLDEETRPVAAQAESDPKARLRHEFDQLAREACNDAGVEYFGLQKNANQRDRQRFSYGAGEGDHAKLYFADIGSNDPIANEVMSRFIDRAGGDDGTPLGLCGAWLATEVMGKLNAKMPYADCLEWAKQTVINTISDRLTGLEMVNNTRTGYHKRDDSPRQITPPLASMLMTHLRQPQGAIYPVATEPPQVRYEQLLVSAGLQPNQPARIMPKAEFVAMQQSPVASVSRRGSAVLDTRDRLLINMADVSTEHLPIASTKAELQLTADPDVLRAGTVIGYELVAYNPDTNTAQYALSERDPYDAANIAINDGQRRQLQFMYEQWGMTELAQQVDGIDTVATLVDQLRAASDYTFTEQSEPLTNGAPVPIVQGRPQVQCTGAANLLQYSLQTIFPHASANVLSGYVVLSQKTTIARLGHAQVMFIHDGNRVLLDATPASQEVAVPGQAAERAMAAGRRQRMTALLKRNRSKQTIIAEDVAAPAAPGTKAIAPMYNSTTEAELAKPTPSAEQLRKKLETQLMTALSFEHRPALLKHISQRQADDPLRRVMQVAVQSTGEGVQVDIPALKQYIQLYGDPKNAATLKQRHLPAHDQRLLRLLDSYLDDVLRTL